MRSKAKRLFRGFYADAVNFEEYPSGFHYSHPSFGITGLSGKILIHTFPSRFKNRLIAIRAASICRLVIQHGWRAFSPKEPNVIVEPRYALPRILPRIVFRYFVRFGINMGFYPFAFFLIFTRLALAEIVNCTFSINIDILNHLYLYLKEIQTTY
jgi:hypothetical protein